MTRPTPADWRNVSLLVFLAMVFVGPIERIVIGQDDEPLELALIENGKMLRSFDVLIKHEAIDDEGVVAVVFYRLALSLERSEFFCLRTGKTWVGRELQPADKERRYVFFTELRMADGKECLSKEFPGRIDSMFEYDLRRIATLSDALDPRLVGLEVGPAGFGHNIEWSFDRFVAKAPAGYRVLATRQGIRQSDGLIEQQRQSRETIPKGTLRGRSVSFWNPKTLMPEEKYDYAVFNGESKIQATETFEWSRQGGCYVPLRYSIETTIPHFEGMEKVDVPDKLSLVVFHFFQVNEPIDRKLLDRKWFDDLGKVVRLADPAHLGIDASFK